MLRLIAMFTMMLDHIGWAFLPDPMVLTWIGRIAFPLYAFLLADGFLFVKDDAKRLTHHVAILLVLAIVSEPCFDLMDFGLNFSRYLNSQNNIITLLLGYLALIATNALAPDGRLSLQVGRRLNTAALVCAYALASFTNYMVKGNSTSSDPFWSWPPIGTTARHAALTMATLPCRSHDVSLPLSLSSLSISSSISC